MSPAFYLAQQLLNALQIGLFYALIAVAYVLFHGVTGRFNLAFGALAIWAAYLALAVFESGLARRGLPVAAMLTLAVAAGVGGAAVLGRAVAASVRPILGMPPLAVLVATLGWAIALEEAVRLSAGNRELWLGPLLSAPAVALVVPDGALQVTGLQAVLWACGAAALGATFLLMRASPFGRLWRAASQDPGMCELLGVDTLRVYMASATLAAVLSGLSGALSGLAYGNASFHGGFVIAMKALFAALLGGLHSPVGAAAAGFALALAESGWSAYFPGDYRDVAVFVGLAALLVLRPAGLGARGGSAALRV